MESIVHMNLESVAYVYKENIRPMDKEERELWTGHFLHFQDYFNHIFFLFQFDIG